MRDARSRLNAIRPTRRAQLKDRIEQPIGVMLGQGQHEVPQGLPGVFVHSANHAEVDQPYAATRLDEQIARMQVCMEEAILEYHLEHYPGPMVGQRRPVDSRSLECSQVGYLQPCEPL